MRMIEKFDNFETRCRKLGHQVTFKYCRTVNNNIPCSKIMDCWYEIITIQDFINNNYSKKEIQKILNPPTPKLTTIIDLINQAKKHL